MKADWRRLRRMMALAILTLGAVLSWEHAGVGHAAVFVVNETADGLDIAPGDGVCDRDATAPGPQCSLRAAILEANANPGPDTIAFAIGTGPRTLVVDVALGPLPVVTDLVVIDATTQPGFTGEPLIELRPLTLSDVDGLVIAAGGSTVRGLVINGFDTGLVLTGAGGTTVENNALGPDLSGTGGPGNLTAGIRIESPANRVTENSISFNQQAGAVLTGSLVVSNTLTTNNITDNGGAGIVNLGGAGNTFSQGAFSGNGGLAIDNGGDGVTPNDPLDADLGPNNRLNFPVVGLARDIGGGQLQLAVLYDGLPSTTFGLEYFSSVECDPAGNGEGQHSIGTRVIPTNAQGQVSFTQLVLLVPGDQFVTGLATNLSDGSTSEFGPCVPITGGPASATPTQTQAPTATDTEAAPATATPTATSTATPTPTATATVTSTPSETPSPTPTEPPAPTATGTSTATATQTATSSPTPTHTPTSTPTESASFTPAPTATHTPSATPTHTSTASATSTATPSHTPSPTPSNTPPPTFTPSPTPTPVAEECQVISALGWFEPSQGVWQDDYTFVDLPGKRLTLASNLGVTTVYTAELKMVKDRATLLFGIRGSNDPLVDPIRDQVTFTGLATGTTPIPVKFRFTLFDSAGPSLLWESTTAVVSGTLPLGGPCGAPQPFAVSLDAGNGLPPPAVGAFTFPNVGPYSLRADLLRADGTATGLRVDVNGEVVETNGLQVHFVPGFLSAGAGAMAPQLQGHSNRLADLSYFRIPDYFPWAPGEMRVVPEFVRNLRPRIRPGAPRAALRAEINDLMRAGALLANANRVVVVLYTDDFDPLLPVIYRGAAGWTDTQKIILYSQDPAVAPRPNVDDTTVAHELVHTLPYLWLDPDMLRECQRDYHNLRTLDAHGHQITLNGTESRRAMRRSPAVMGAGPVENTWITQCTYWHLLNVLSGEVPDPPVILVRGLIDRSAAPITGSLRPAYQIMGFVDVPAGPGGDWVIVLRDGAGGELGRFPFEPEFQASEADEENDVVSFGVRLPDLFGTARIDLLGPGGALLDSLAYSASAPSVGVTTPVSGTAVRLGSSNAVRVRWTGADGDGDTLLYSVLYSPDQGTTWQNQSFEQSETEWCVVVDPTSSTHAVKVVANDGAQSTEAVVNFTTTNDPSVEGDCGEPAVFAGFPEPDGQNGWFVSGPVAGTVVADDSLTGGSTITAVECAGGVLGPISGLGTPRAVVSVTVSTEGASQVACTASDSAGRSGASHLSINAAAILLDTVAPVIEIAAPGDGDVYALNQAVAADYACADVTSGLAACAGPVASGDYVDTSRPGQYEFTVVAVDQAGNQTQLSRTYTVLDNNVLLNGDFESGPGAGWSEFSLHGRALITTDLPHAGSYGAHLCGLNRCLDLIQQSITIPAGGRLTYWWHVTSQDSTTHPRDLLSVALYRDDGRLAALLRVHTNAGPRGAWRQQTVDLSRWAGQELTLIFLATGNHTWPTHFYLDDVQVQ